MSREFWAIIPNPIDRWLLTLDLTPNPKERGRGGDRRRRNCRKGRRSNDATHGSTSRSRSN